MVGNENQNEHTLLAIKDELKKVLSETQKSRIPLFIAALAALLSIISLADDETDKVAMSAHIEAANEFSYFQAKSIRRTDTLIAAQMFANMQQPEPAAFRQKKADRYGNEKKKILKKAREQQAIRSDALHRGDYYKVGATLLQIAIVLASASMVVGGGTLFYASIFLTLVSLVYSINGVGMFYEFPTDPGPAMEWINLKFHQIKAG